MLDDFLLRAIAAGLGIAIVAGPLGCFIVWRRMAFFGGALAHATLLGIALGLLLDINLTLALIVAGMAFALVLAGLQTQRQIPTDTLLGILAHAALAAGLFALGLMEWLRVDLLGYLFGDVLAVTMADIAWIWGGGIVALGVLALIWRPLLAVTVHEEMARAEGVPAAAVKLAYMMLLALVIAVSMKIVGVLLIVSMLIIPAAAARPFARTPEAMAMIAALIGVAAVLGGLAGSFAWDTPSGPTIVLAATVIFLVSIAAGGVLRRGSA